MKQCKICLDADSCSFDWRDPDCEYMNCTEFKKPPLTNADRIRAMSDDELAKTISGDAIYPWCTEEPCKYESCTDCVLAWLKQEATNAG